MNCNGFLVIQCWDGRTPERSAWLHNYESLYDILFPDTAKVGHSGFPNGDTFYCNKNVSALKLQMIMGVCMVVTHTTYVTTGWKKLCEGDVFLRILRKESTNTDL